MKKNLLFIFSICFLFLSGLSFAQTTKIWVGGNAGTWSIAGNWSPAGPPSGNDTAVFNSSTLVSLDVNLTLGALQILNNAVVELNAPATRDILVFGLTDASPGLFVEKGATFIMSTVSSAFHFSFATSGKAYINGTMICKGSNSSGDARLQADVLGTNRIYINGTYLSDQNSGNIYGDTRTLFFNKGSVFQLNDNGGTVPNAKWDTASTIKLTGANTSGPVFLTSGFSDTYYGNIEYDCSNQSVDINLSIATSNTYKSILLGNLLIKSTNQKKLSLATNLKNFFINGDFEMTNASTTVSMGNGAFGVSSMQVGGNFSIDEATSTFIMQENKDGNDTLRVGGNLLLNGILNSKSSVAGLFELNGSKSQDLKVIGGITGNINIKLNNSNGAVMLSDVVVPEKFYLTNGIITTGSFFRLTINNPDVNSIEGGSASSFVAGNLSRKTNTTNEYIYTVGRDVLYRPISVTPTTSNESVYRVEYVSKNPLTFVSSALSFPIANLCNTEYWNVSRLSGDAASVKLFLNGAVSATPNNPIASDTLIAALYDASTWIDVSGNSGYLLPGNSASGYVQTEPLSFFVSLSFGVRGNLLPIRLISFKANKINNKSSLIEWVTDGLENKGSFELLRSNDSKNFSNIISIPAVLNKSQYSFTDNFLPSGVSYYKLKMIDRDNKVTYSDIKTVISNNKGLFINYVSPTITKSNILVNVYSDKNIEGQILIYNLNGVLLKRLNKTILNGENKLTIDVSLLASGNYKLLMVSDSIKTNLVDFIKN